MTTTEAFAGQHHNLIRLFLGDNIDRGFFEDVQLGDWQYVLEMWFTDFIADLVFEGDVTLVDSLEVDTDLLSTFYLDWAVTLEEERRADIAYMESN